MITIHKFIRQPQLHSINFIEFIQEFILQEKCHCVLVCFYLVANPNFNVLDSI